MGDAGSVFGSEEEEEELISFRETGGDVVALVIGLDYKYLPPEHQLNSSQDAQKMHGILSRAGKRKVKVVYDNALGTPAFPSKDAFITYLRMSAMQCRAGDWFVVYYAGHGINVPDTNGDERSGMDQAFVTPTIRGQLNPQKFLIDDDFAMALDSFVPPGVRILVLADCCHSGTICDIDTYRYKHEIYQISAAQDSEEAEQIRSGGLFTVSLLHALQKLVGEYGSGEYSIQEVADYCEEFSKLLTKWPDLQNISFQWSGTDPNVVAWPLCWSIWVECILLRSAGVGFQ